MRNIRNHRSPSERAIELYNNMVSDNLATMFVDRNGEAPVHNIATSSKNLPKMKESIIEILKLYLESGNEYELKFDSRSEASDIFFITDFLAVRISILEYLETNYLEQILDNLEIDLYGKKIDFVLQFNADQVTLEPVREILESNFLITKKSVEDESNKVGIFRKNGSGNLYVSYTDLESRVSEISIEDHYNDDFVETNDNIMNCIENKDYGIILLYGDPGTGKTTYLRNLIRQKISKNFIYMPPFMTQMLGSPEFMAFLMNESENDKKNVYVIEDAENALKTREAGGNEAVANILNASDGIMGDIINSQFIFTFNCQIDEIDGALKRPGRLLEQYEFRTLEKEKTAKLWAEVNGGEPPKDKMSLAEIFNHKTTINTEESRENNKPSFGFIQKSA